MVIWIRVFGNYEPAMYVSKDTLRFKSVVYLRTENEKFDVYMDTITGELYVTKAILRGGRNVYCSQ